MSTPQASCLNVASHVDVRFGGIVTSLASSGKALEAEGRYSSPIAAFCLPGETFSQGFRPAVHRFPYSHVDWLRGGDAVRRLSCLVEASNIVHVHGLWEAHCVVSCRMARRMAKPYVVSAHGMLEPWALRQHRWKKTLYAALIERANLAGAVCLRAFTESEVMQYREFGLRNPVVAIPNGVDIPERLTPEPFFERYPELRGRTLILFLGRLHQKKGLYPLCSAWRDVSRRFAEAHLVLAGPDDGGTRAETERLLSLGGVRSSVTFTGLLTGSMKWSAHAAADVFILPSYSEGFSVSVLEALGAGTPVVITENCNFPELPRIGAGWLTSVKSTAIAETLTAVLSLPASERRAAGERGLALVAAQFSWRSVARRLADVFDWLRGGTRPDCVVAPR